MNVLEMKEIIKEKIDNTQDEVLLKRINDLINAAANEPRLTADELFDFTVSRFENTLKRLAQ
ncbi:hypothetical protein ACFOW1_04655 [Parasediminibacterium paludis]|uniref:Uncharacterized protein n=1 Tax=Parasediminibacterium paludis TaxID=908966 RepID=A0ABV8PT25_9BACT